jgi:hypothetical protein
VLHISADEPSTRKVVGKTYRSRKNAGAKRARRARCTTRTSVGKTYSSEKSRAHLSQLGLESLKRELLDGARKKNVRRTIETNLVREGKTNVTENAFLFTADRSKRHG